MEKKRDLSPKLTVVGVGGAGSNAVNNMIRSGLEGVNFVVCNTDAQALQVSQAPEKIQLGLEMTQGLGAGSRPDVGRAAAEESLDEVLAHLKGANMIFITAGMGGGTGTGGAPVIAKAAREAGILTVGVVTRPFHFEGAKRTQLAEEGIEIMNDSVDTLLVIPNQNLFRLATEQTTFSDAFAMADDVLYSGVRTFTDLMIKHGLINLDFADICAVMREMKGKAMMGTGQASGERRAVEAAEQAISCPLLDSDITMKGARAVLINITGGPDMTLFEVDEAANRIREEVDPNANIIFGATFDEALSGELRVAVVATGISAQESGHVLTSKVETYSENSRSLRHLDTPSVSLEENVEGFSLSNLPKEPEIKEEMGDRHNVFAEGLETPEKSDEKPLDPFSSPTKVWSLHEEAEENAPEPPKKGRRAFSLLEKLGMRRVRDDTDRETASSKKPRLVNDEDSDEFSEETGELPAFMRQGKSR